jgi:adenylate cyclase
VDGQVQPTVGVLEVRRAGAEPTQRELRAGEALRVGRDAANQVVLVDGLVSRFHAVFNGSISGIILSDLSSLNGTVVNGRRITTPVALKPHDVVSIGTTEIVIRPGTSADPTTAGVVASTLMDQLRRVDITVLVADVSGFTNFSEQLAPNDVAAMLQLWFSRVSETVEEFGGEVDKYIGDCVMALWRGSEADAHRLASHAADAGLAIVERTDVLSASGVWAYHASNPWRCRVSLNSGEALMGTLGGARARDFTVLGDTVNLAFRLNDLAGKIDRKIVIGAATAKLVDDEFGLERLGLTRVEGRGGAVEIFSLLGRNRLPGSTCG